MKQTRHNSLESNASYHRTAEGQFRVFGEKKYLLHNDYSTKTDAQRAAVALQKNGFLTRIIAVDRGYVYPYLKTGEKIHKKMYQLYMRLRDTTYGKEYSFH